MSATTWATRSSSRRVPGQTAIAQALCELAAGAGYDVVIAAPGGKRERFAAASDWIEDLDDVAKIKRTASAIVVATQGSGDARGLDAALTLGAAYIGLIASPKKSARLKETLKKRGFDANAVDRIDAPAGMNIGAVTPEEIAVSVLAELVQRRRHRKAESDIAGEHAGTR